MFNILKSFHCKRVVYLVELSNPVRMFPMASNPAGDPKGPSPFLVKYGKTYLPGFPINLIGS